MRKKVAVAVALVWNDYVSYRVFIAAAVFLLLFDIQRCNERIRKYGVCLWSNWDGVSTLMPFAAAVILCILVKLIINQFTQQNAHYGGVIG